MTAKRAGHKPFASKAQARLFYGSPKLRRYANAKEGATDKSGGIKRLPERVGTRKVGKSRGLRKRA